MKQMTTELAKKTKLSLEEKQEVIILYLNGEEINTIKKKYNTSKKVIDNALSNQELRTQIEKKHFENTRAMETRKIDELKTKAYGVIGAALDDIEGMENGRQAYISELNSIVDKIDKISRLNRGEATEVTKHTETKETKDYAKIIKELKDATPEQKKAFLSKQQAVEAQVTVVAN